MLKMAVLAPTPKASVRTATTSERGLLRSMRNHNEYPEIALR